MRRSNYVEKKFEKIFHNFFYFVPKNSLGFLIRKLPLLHFFSKRWQSYGHLYLLASEALHIVRIANITKPLRILYQISKVFLNLAQAALSAMTLPHLVNIYMYKTIEARVNTIAIPTTGKSCSLYQELLKPVWVIYQQRLKEFLI